MAKTKKPGFPPTVYVRWSEERGEWEDFLVVDQKLGLLNHGDRVGIYDLREVKTMRVTRTLEPSE